jgi:hypothetical protein
MQSIRLSDFRAATRQANPAGQRFGDAYNARREAFEDKKRDVRVERAVPTDDRKEMKRRLNEAKERAREKAAGPRVEQKKKPVPRGPRDPQADPSGAGKMIYGEGTDQDPFIIDQRRDVMDWCTKHGWRYHGMHAERFTDDETPEGRIAAQGRRREIATISKMGDPDEKKYTTYWAYSERAEALVAKTRLELAADPMYMDRDPDPAKNCMRGECLRPLGDIEVTKVVVCPCGFGAWCDTMCYAIDHERHNRICLQPLKLDNERKKGEVMLSAITKAQQQEEDRMWNGYPRRMRGPPTTRRWIVVRPHKTCTCGECHNLGPVHEVWRLYFKRRNEMAGKRHEAETERRRKANKQAAREREEQEEKMKAERIAEWKRKTKERQMNPDKQRLKEEADERLMCHRMGVNKMTPDLRLEYQYRMLRARSFLDELECKGGATLRRIEHKVAGDTGVGPL